MQDALLLKMEYSETVLRAEFSLLTTLAVKFCFGFLFVFLFIVFL